MKYVITENQSTELFSNLLKKLNITFHISYMSDNGRDSITAMVFLYKNGEPLGYRNGYDFYFKYDSLFNRLKPDGRWPHLEHKDEFGFMPPEMVLGFFTDKVETYLKNYIDKGYTNLKRK